MWRRVRGGDGEIGRAVGRCDGNEPPAAAYGATQALLARFTAEFGSTNCADLLDGCDLGPAEGQARFRAEGLRERCRVFTTRAADLAAAIVDEMG